MCLLFSITSIHPNFPQLPENFYDWGKRESYRPYWLTMPLDTLLKGTPPIKDIALLPFTLTIPEIKLSEGKIDTTEGWVEYITEPSDVSYIGNGVICVYWRPHRKGIITRNLVMSDMHKALVAAVDGSSAFDKDGIILVRRPNILAFRLRAWWWWMGCDGWEHLVGAVTVYFIPGEKHDFLLTCQTCFYNFGPPEDYGDFPGDTAWEHFYPKQKDRILELERAVEETFRPK